MIRMECDSDAFVIELDEVEAFRNMIGSMSKREILLHVNEDECSTILYLYNDACLLTKW